MSVLIKAHIVASRIDLRRATIENLCMPQVCISMFFHGWAGMAHELLEHHGQCQWNIKSKEESTNKYEKGKDVVVINLRLWALDEGRPSANSIRSCTCVWTMNLPMSWATYQPYVSCRSQEQRRYWGMVALIKKRNNKTHNTMQYERDGRKWNRLSSF